MWQDKKFIITASLLVVLIAAVGTIGGLSLAQQYDNDRVRTAHIQVMENANDIFQGIKGAFNPQESLNNYLDKLVKDGKITQEQADEFKDWIESRPDIPAVFGIFNNPGMMHMGNGGGMFGFGWNK